MARPVVDLPQPDSPTRPSVSPRSTKKSIPSTARTAPTWRWKMIPCVSGKCILSACTVRRFIPLSAVAVERLRWMNSSFGGVMFVVTAISSLPRRVRRRDGRGLLLDRLEESRVADLALPIRVDEPPALLRAPAPRLVIGLRVRYPFQLRLLLAADIAPVLAARLELAAWRRGDEVRREALDRHELRFARLVQTRDRAEQAPGVGHLRIREELDGVGLLDDPTRVHDIDALRHARDNAQVVRDEDERRAELARQVLEQIEDLRLDRHVERSRRLVGEDELGAARKGHRDHHALSHTAGELVRVIVDALLRTRDLHELEQLDGPVARLVLVHLHVELERLRDLTADRQDRIQARHRVLEDHRDVLTADAPDVVIVHLQDVLTVEHDRTRDDLPRRLRDEAHERQCGHGFSATGLAHDAERFAGGDLERHAVDGAHDTITREQ